MKGIWNFISTVSILVLTFVFLRWYIKGHFGKYFIFFWLWTIISIVIYLNNPGYNTNWPQRDNRTGAEVWNSNY